MYVDGYVISGLLIVALTCGLLGYAGWFGYRHIKRDAAKATPKKKNL
ncbi:MAG: hypothetical protein GYB33_17520 [Gammaproteobacteria bacterium]|nr:hypothetical protein [Gammaproteobacteria bacterium]